MTRVTLPSALGEVASVERGIDVVEAHGKRRHRLVFIDVLRAIAVLSVFGLHIHGYWVNSDAISHTSAAFVLDRVFAQGAAGVDLFIVLSGFCLTYPLARGRASGLAAISTLRFYKRRAFRILPAYYAALALVVGLESFPAVQQRLVAAPIGPKQIAAHAFLVQPWWKPFEGTINGPLWSVSLEVTLYVVFPVLLIVRRRFGWSILLAASIALSVGWAGIAAGAEHTIAGDSYPSFSHLLPAHLFEFVLGMLAAELVCRPRDRQVSVAGALLIAGSAGGGAGTITNQELVRVLGWGVAAFGLTLLLSQMRLVTSARPNLLVRALTRLGVVSYSFYLLHQPFILLVSPLARHVDGVYGRYAEGLLALFVMAAIATIFFKLIERPFLVAGGMKDAIIPDREEPQSHRSSRSQLSFDGGSAIDVRE